MLGLKRRRKVEGWAVDASELDADINASSFRQRLADNNKLWTACFVIVLLAAFFMLKSAKSGRDLGLDDKASLKGIGYYTDSAHTDYARDFVKKYSDEKMNVGVVLDAKFVSPETFRFTVPSDMSADDIEYMSRMAAMKIYRVFKKTFRVEAYVGGTRSGKALAAITAWDSEKHGFLTKTMDRDSQNQ